ncbi:MAG: DNA mismatch repair endonuclease MutL [Agathobacter sp.]|uniref:DNA mismatch repair endonuclease MutL n=1 Tax=Agathobacter sp. TaxID=2021311 RepID=UPI00257CE377|nr:DNA mismatch repair endonuclease MutL [Agathobacter sp.]MBQ1680848.1 DNA mismatch repair endonuclease MutL [Agathobacter sp.]
MPNIELLTQETIDQIAAGEVVERPASVVKELVENAIDANASAVTVEIKDGGTSLIRITDNGWGIEKNQIQKAFLRHSTSKIRCIDDLLKVSSLGFRGEALSSISSVSRVELVTKTMSDLTGNRYVIEGSKEISLEEIGAPDGTTFLVRDIFYNVPARKKFLKSNQTEAAYIADIVEKLALSHPDISFKYIQQNQTKLHTSGNGNLRDVIYHVYGREISANLIKVSGSCEFFEVTGYIGMPTVSRGNRNYENYYINGRYIKSKVIAKAIEESYKNYMMQHQYPFTMLYFTFPDGALDVNVHPQKMEVRFDHQQEIYQKIVSILTDAIHGQELIPEVPIGEEKKEPQKIYSEPIPEPFEERRIQDIRKNIAKDSPYEPRYVHHVIPQKPIPSIHRDNYQFTDHRDFLTQPDEQAKAADSNQNQNRNQNQNQNNEYQNKEYQNTENQSPMVAEPEIEYHEMTLGEYDKGFLSQESRKKHKIIGQLFETYWLVEFEDQLYIIDQHAAHEKVLYERTMKLLDQKEVTSQMITPPIFVSLDAKEEEALISNREYIEDLGYIIENFGGREYIIRGIPGNLFNLDMKELFTQMLDEFHDFAGRQTPDLIREKVASMSCKAAVKGNNRLSMAEIDELFTELLSLDNPYHCPHGRPTIITMTKYEIEKKFKRII